jgi:hypothetical protein
MLVVKCERELRGQSLQEPRLVTCRNAAGIRRAIVAQRVARQACLATIISIIKAESFSMVLEIWGPNALVKSGIGGDEWLIRTRFLRVREGPTREMLFGKDINPCQLGLSCRSLPCFPGNTESLSRLGRPLSLHLQGC